MTTRRDMDEELTRLTEEDVLALVHTRSRRFRRQIRVRDWREVVAAVVVGVLIAPAALRGALLARIGAVIVLAGLVIIVVKLWHGRRALTASSPDLALPVATALRHEVRAIDAQIALLQTVEWWYVAPVMIGSVMLVAGERGRAGLWFTVTYAMFAALLSWAIIAVNHRVVRRTLRPKREEVVRLLRHLES